MSRLLPFLAGVFFSVLVAGGLAAWFLFVTPVSEKTKVTPGASSSQTNVAPSREVPMPAVPRQVGIATSTATGTAQATMNFPSANDVRQAQEGSVGPIFVEGRVVFPPLVRKLIEKHPKATMAMRFMASASVPTGRGNLVPQGAVSKITYPFTYRLEVDPSWVLTLQRFATFPMLVRVVVCLTPDEKQPCGGGQLPNVEGTVRFFAKIPASTKGPVAISVPSVVMNRYQPPPNAAACKDSGGTISGSFVTTPAFQKAGMKRVLVLGSPYHDKKPPVPYAGPPGMENVAKVTQQDLAAMGKFGIVYTPLGLQGNTTPFSLTIPADFRTDLYRLYYLPCPDGTADNTCLANAFPISMLQVPKEPIQKVVALASEGFEAPSCGTKGRIFYAHVWDRNAPAATEEAVHMANPPELIEGAVY